MLMLMTSLLYMLCKICQVVMLWKMLSNVYYQFYSPETAHLRILLSHRVGNNIGQAFWMSYDKDLASQRDLIKLCQEEQLKKALHEIYIMDQRGVSISRDVIYCLLQKCTSKKDLEAGRQVYALMVSNGFDSISVLGDHLIRLFVLCGSLLDAKHVFHKVAKPTVHTWNAIISAHIKLGRAQGAFLLYKEMQQQGVKPDKVSYLFILKTCGNTGAIEQGRRTHDRIVRTGLDSDVAVANTLVDMYAKSRILEDARKVFDKLPNCDVVSCSAMITGYTQHGQGLPALEIFEKMQQKCIWPDNIVLSCIMKACGTVGAIEPGRLAHIELLRHSLESDIVIGSTLIDVYAKFGNLEEASKVFKKLHNRDVALWGTMLTSYASYGNFKLVLQCLEGMRQQGLKPDEMIFTSVLTACSHAGLLEEGHKYFKSMKEEHGMSPSIEHYNCMVDLLGRAGSLDEAEYLLQTMPVSPDAVGWRCLLTGCRIYGRMDLGRRCFDEVVRLDPNDASGYMLMMSMYADAQMWEDVDKLQELRRSAAVPKKPGMAWLEVDNSVHEFMVGDDSHTENDEMYAKLNGLSKVMKDEGYIPQLELHLRLMLGKDQEDASLVGKDFWCQMRTEMMS